MADLGEAILLRFASEGYHVVVTDIGDTGDRHLASSSDMESVAAGLKSTGGRRALSSLRRPLARLGSRVIWRGHRALRPVRRAGQ